MKVSLGISSVMLKIVNNVTKALCCAVNNIDPENRARLLSMVSKGSLHQSKPKKEKNS